MPVGQISAQIPLYLGRVVTSDPTQRIFEVTLNASGQRVQVMTTPVASRWPIVGETWSIQFINNTPYLVEPYQLYQRGPANTIESIPAGDAWINSPTGIVHIIGSGDGSSDFTFEASSWPVRGAATLTGGTVVVPAPSITVQSLIFLTAQDNNTTGSLRVSARSIGMSFTILSSSNLDHGVVGYQIWNS